MADLRRAVARANALEDMASELVQEAVRRCRSGSCSWEEIGVALGTSKQAAQQRYASGVDERSMDVSNSEMGTMLDQLTELVAGPAVRLAEVPRGKGGAAG